MWRSIIEGRDSESLRLRCFWITAVPDEILSLPTFLDEKTIPTPDLATSTPSSKSEPDKEGKSNSDRVYAFRTIKTSIIWPCGGLHKHKTRRKARRGISFLEKLTAFQRPSPIDGACRDRRRENAETVSARPCASRGVYSSAGVASLCPYRPVDGSPPRASTIELVPEHRTETYRSWEVKSVPCQGANTSSCLPPGFTKLGPYLSSRPSNLTDRYPTAMPLQDLNRCDRSSPSPSSSTAAGQRNK